MRKVKLIKYKEPYLTQGMLLRFVTRGFYEEKEIDFMLFYPAEEDVGLGLMTITGFHAGDVLVLLPAESQYTNYFTLSTKWLIENWNKWVCEECDVNEVIVIERLNNPVKES